ncbi:MAG: TonB family protein [Bacteroidetes bacterium]|nr:TonB family protein [Bacteroidota bacterium]
MSESWYLDSNFQVRDGGYTQFQAYNRSKVAVRGQYDRGKKSGTWVSYSDNGKSTDSGFYSGGHLTRYRSYYPNGKLSDSAWIGADGKGISIGYRENGLPEHKGQYSNWQKTGPWSYYTKEGILCTVETMQADTIVSAVDYDAQGGNPHPHTGAFEKESDYPGGVSRWIDYLRSCMTEDKLPKAFLAGKTPQGTVVIMFVVDEGGNVGDIRVQHSVFNQLDELACNIIRKSGRWIPAVQHNRNVKSYKRQPIVFRLED